MRIGGFCASIVRIWTGEVWGAQDLALTVCVRIEEERVVHLAGRVTFGEVQRGEIVIVGLDIRTFGDRETHVGKDRSDFVDDLADRMDTAALGRRGTHRQRDVDGFAGQPLGNSRVLQVGLAGGNRGKNIGLQRVDRRTACLAFFRRHGAERL
jgi:hypothetical protein